MHSDYITFKERENIELGYGSVDPYLANIRSGRPLPPVLSIRPAAARRSSSSASTAAGTR